MFLAGAVILIREGRSHQQADGEEFVEDAKDVHGFRAVLASFLVLFAAEWGDLSQLLTISLVAQYEDPVSVFIGALARAARGQRARGARRARPCCASSSLHVLHYVGAGGLPAARRAHARRAAPLT